MGNVGGVWSLWNDHTDDAGDRHEDRDQEQGVSEPDEDSCGLGGTAQLPTQQDSNEPLEETSKPHGDS